MSSWDKRGFNLNNIIKDKFNINLSKEEINYIYNLAVKKCEIGDFQNALPIFQYLKAIASCFQNLEQYMEAYMYYQSAFVVDFNNNQDCLFYMGFCAIKMQKPDQARDLLNQFIKANSGHEFEKKAKLLLHGLENSKT
jgi:tetratricopeptide (TPR) repeat protein